MEIERFRGLLSRHSRIALDTPIFIYQWEANPRYSHLTDFIFSSLEQSDFAAATSTITMTGLLVHPYREQDVKRANELFVLLTTYPNLDWISPTLEIAALAAQIRAVHRLHTPDALQAATAAQANAAVMLTNDPIFRRIPDFETLILDDFV